MNMGIRGPIPWRVPLLAGLFLALIYALTFPGAIGPRISDGRAMFLVTRALVDRRDVAIIPTARSEVAIAPGWRPLPLPAPGPCVTEANVNGIGARPGGPYFVKYGIGQSIAAAPLYALGVLAAALWQSAYRAEVAAFVTSFFCPLVIALTAALLCALALRLGWSPRASLALALLYGLATPAWAYTGTFFSEPLLGLSLLGTVAALLWAAPSPSVRGAALAGVCLAGAVLVHVESALYAVPVAYFLLARGGRERRVALLAACALPLFVGLALTGAYDQARFGSVVSNGYGIIGDHHDLHPPHTLRALWEGVYGPLLSPGKGLFLYAPILLLLPWALRRLGRRAPGAGTLVVGIGAVAVLAHANTLVVWLGGWAWGPRFLVPIIPLLVLPLGALLDGARRATRIAAWALGLLGLVIQAPGVLLDAGVYITYLRDTTAAGCIWRAEDLYKWQPRYSPIIGQWARLLAPATYRQQTAYLHTGQGLAAITPAGVGVDNAFVPLPRTWWTLLADQGVSDFVLTAAALLVLLAALATLLLAVRAAATRPASEERPRQSATRVVVRF